MPLEDRDYIRGKHPPTCTCAECVNIRLKHLRRVSSTEHSKGYNSYMNPSKTHPKNTTRNRGRGLPGYITFLLVIFGLALLGFGLFTLSNTSPTTVFAPIKEYLGGGYTNQEGFTIYEHTQPPYRGATSAQVNLVNSKSSRNPTWEELKDFLKSDKTDKDSYSLQFRVCADFAEKLHNDAESAGLKAAWVSVCFESNTEGHALNAFQTTDKGLIFVDCTGKGFSFITPVPILISPSGTSWSKTYGGSDSWDKVVYLETGKEYGIVSLDVAEPTGYTFYEQYKRKLQDFKTALDNYSWKVQSFNQKVAAKSQTVTIRLPPILIPGREEEYNQQVWEYNQWVEAYNQQQEVEYAKLKMEESELENLSRSLDKMASSLGAFWEPLDIVSKVEIYW